MPASPETVDSDLVICRERPDQPEVVELLDALDAYLRELYEPEANHILEVRELLVPEVHFLVARQASRAVGCAAVRRMPAEAATGHRAYGEIKRMVVRPECRGARIAERLLVALESTLAEQGISLALLETGSEQHAAVRLYRRSGYARRGPFGGYPDNGLSLFMEKRL